jgi:hypothetical protein
MLDIAGVVYGVVRRYFLAAQLSDMLFYTAVFTTIIRAIYCITFIVVDDVCKIRLAVIIVFPVKGATVADIGIRFEEIYQPVFPA